jgi:serine/threonine protein kinase
VDSLETLVQDRLAQDRLAQDRLARTGTPAEIPAAPPPPTSTPALTSTPPFALADPALARPAPADPARAVPRGAGERPGEGALLHGRYRLLERLGAGGFGVVWRARDELLHREVALKRIPLPPDTSSRAGRSRDGRDEPRAGERASREALACARLAHPAIVALYEAYVDDDAFYLVSELVHGDTLAELVAADGCSDEELLEIALALAHALIHAHARGVIHRDVKPQNVLVPHERSAHASPAKLTDFGGASLAGEDALTRTGETLGTLAYMAPEQSEGREPAEPADLYSLALVIYEGLTGANPVRGPTPAATARRIGRRLPTLAARRPDLPRALTDALDTALAVDPARRGTLRELCEALERTLAEGLTRRRGSLRPRTAPHGPNRAPWSGRSRRRASPACSRADAYPPLPPAQTPATGRCPHIGSIPPGSLGRATTAPTETPCPRRSGVCRCRARCGSGAPSRSPSGSS